MDELFADNDTPIREKARKFWGAMSEAPNNFRLGELASCLGMHLGLAEEEIIDRLIHAGPTGETPLEMLWDCRLNEAAVLLGADHD